MELAVLQLRVGQRLGVVPAAGTLNAEDTELIGAAYETLLAELYEHELASWNVADAVPDEFADILIGMSAARLGEEFKLPEPRRSAILAQSAFGMPTPTPDERRLRRLAAVENFGDTVKAEYY